MNELLFFCHILVLLACLLGTVRLGKQALLIAFALQMILANLFIAKEITLFGLNVTATDMYTIGSIFTLSCIQEFYGKVEARKMIWTGFSFLILVGLMVKFHLLYKPSVGDTTHFAYLTIFSSTPRIIIASLGTAFLADRIDINLYAFFQKKLPLIGRFALSTLIAQFFDTLLFSFAALYGSVSNITHIIFFSYLVKVVAIAIIAPFMILAKKLVQKEHHAL